MMTDHEIETRLRNTLGAMADTTQVEDRPLVRLEHLSPQPRSWFARPAIAVAFGFLLVLVSVGAALLFVGRGVEPGAGVAPTIERFPVFGALPEGVNIAAEVDLLPAEPRYVKTVVGTRTATGFTNAVNILVWEEPVTVTIPESETVMVGNIEVEISPADPAQRDEVGVTAFWWLDGTHLQAHDPAGRADLVLDVVKAISINDTEGLKAESIKVSGLPSGMEILADPQLGTSEPSGRVTAQFTDGQLVATVSRSSSALAAAVLGGSGEAIEVRNRPGYLTRVADWDILTWQEAPTVAAKLSATAGAFTLEQLLSYAEDISYVDEATWRTTHPSADRGNEFAPTTTSPPAYAINADGWEIVGGFEDSSQPPIRWVTVLYNAEPPASELEETPILSLATGGPIEAQIRAIESGTTIPDGSFPLLGGEAFILSDFPRAGNILWASPTGTAVAIEYNWIDGDDARELLNGLLPLTESEWNNLLDKHQGGTEVRATEGDPTQ